MQKSTFSVNFFIRRTRLGKSGETPIMMRISVDGRYTELSTQRPRDERQPRQRDG